MKDIKNGRPDNGKGNGQGPKAADEKRLDDRGLLIYLLVTFILTYGIEIFLIMPRVGSTDINQAYMAQTLITWVMLIPAFSALATRLITKEKIRGQNLMLALNLKGNLKYYGLCWFGFVALTLLGTALYFIIFPKQFDPELGYVKVILGTVQGTDAQISTQEARKAVMSQMAAGALFSPLVNFFTCFGEEWGWRGYLLPKLLKRFKVVPALLLSGLIWGLWHAPLTIMGHNYGVGYRGFPFTGILAMCLFCTVMGTILSFVTIRTKSCIPAIMGHGTLNGFAAMGIYFTSLENPYNVFLGPAPTGLVGGAGFIVVAAIVLQRLYKEEKSNGLLL